MLKLNFIKNLNKNTLLIAVAVVGIIVTGVLILANSNLGNLPFKIGGSKLSNEAIAQKSLDYINKNLLNGQTAVLVSTSEESGLIKLKIKIDESEFDSYSTKDGKLLMPYKAINMDESVEQPAQEQNTEPTAENIKQTCDTLEKTDSPVVEAYVVSKCPFGLQMQRILADVVKNAPELNKNIMVRYMGSISDGKIIAMHGDAEAQENLRQICIRDEQRSKYWNYVSCHIKAGDVNNCLGSAGIDQNKLSGCISDKNRGLVYAKEDFDLNTKYDVKGSPTLVLNGANISESSFGGRTSESLKSMICCASSNKPEACSKTLETTQAAASFSETYGSSSSGTTGNSGATGANCAPAQ
ncbi:MAG: hypothetical protein Q8O66_00940 [bacterium]|nr:hypothetical protein [bacterium]